LITRFPAPFPSAYRFFTVGWLHGSHVVIGDVGSSGYVGCAGYTFGYIYVPFTGYVGWLPVALVAVGVTFTFCGYTVTFVDWRCPGLPLTRFCARLLPLGWLRLPHTFVYIFFYVVDHTLDVHLRLLRCAFVLDRSHVVTFARAHSPHFPPHSCYRLLRSRLRFRLVPTFTGCTLRSVVARLLRLRTTRPYGLLRYGLR